MSSEYNFKWNQLVLGELRSMVTERMKGCALKTSNEAKKGAPVLTSTLQNSIRVVDVDSATEIVAAGGEMNGAEVAYARIREYQNNLHPNKKYYMRNAFIWLKDNYKKEFKDLI